MFTEQVRGMQEYIDTWKWTRDQPFNVQEFGAVAYMEKVPARTLLRQYLCYYSPKQPRISQSTSSEDDDEDDEDKVFPDPMIFLVGCIVVFLVLTTFIALCYGWQRNRRRRKLLRYQAVHGVSSLARKRQDRNDEDSPDGTRKLQGIRNAT
jgi:hypothetical protein